MIDIYDYIAICIEFEGYIGIGKSLGKNSYFPHYYVQVAINNTNIELLGHFKNKIKIGTIIGPRKKENEKWKDVYSWRMNINEIKEHLPKILPYLFSKWRQAELIIETLTIIKDKEFCKKLSNKERAEMYSWEEALILESCFQECSILNERGELIKK